MRLLFAAGVAATLLVAGCGDDGDRDGSEPSPTASTSTPSVEPATGKLVELGVGSVRVPAGWKITERLRGSSLGVSATSADNSQAVYISAQERVTDPVTHFQQSSFEDLRDRMDEASKGEPLTVGGNPAYHLIGIDTLDRRDVYGFVVDDTWIELDFSVYGTDGEPDQEVIDSVLASWAS